MREISSDWIKIYTAVQPYKVKMAKILLEENGIESVEINKQDSAYIILGEVELYVRSEKAMEAKYLIAKSLEDKS